MERGADKETKDVHGNGPLYETVNCQETVAVSCADSYNHEILEMLLDAGAIVEENIQIESASLTKICGCSARFEFWVKSGRRRLIWQVKSQFVMKFGAKSDYRVQGLGKLGPQDEILRFRVFSTRFLISDFDLRFSDIENNFEKFKKKK